VCQDKLQRFIERGLVVWQDGVIITYQQYKKRTKVGDVQVPKGAIMLHQILNSEQFSDKGGKVFSVISSSQLTANITSSMIPGAESFKVVVQTPARNTGDLGCSSGGTSSAQILPVN
jgi:hypothetical protein